MSQRILSNGDACAMACVASERVEIAFFGGRRPGYAQSLSLRDRQGGMGRPSLPLRCGISKLLEGC